MRKNREGFTIILAMGIVLIISLTAYNILGYIIPFSKEIKGVENSSKAYYLGNSGIEEGLYDISNRTDLNEKNEFGKNYSGNITYKYNTFSSGYILPQIGEGNSDYDKSSNIIAQGNPLQLSIGYGYLNVTKLFKIFLKVPNLDLYDGNTNTETLSGGTLKIVNWQLSGINNTLNASGGIIIADYINSNNINSNNSNDMFNDAVTGFDLNGISGIKFSDFYTNNCSGSSSGCILKMSVVNNLATTDGVSIPYLEWKIDVSNQTTSLPLRFTKLDSFGKSMGYVKKLEIKVPRKTVNQAFDFTVFQ